MLNIAINIRPPDQSVQLIFSTKADGITAKKLSQCYSSVEYQNIISSDCYKNNHNFTHKVLSCHDLRTCSGTKIK